MQKQTLRELLELVWTRKNGQVDQKMVEFCLKDSNYIDMGNYFLDIGRSKPTIDKTIYYADQDRSTGEMAKDPGTSFETFKRYNKKNSPQSDIDAINESSVTVVIRPQYYGDKTGGILCTWGIKKYFDKLGEKDREATPAEKQIIIEAIKVAAENYDKRLSAYYKKYSSKIRTSSYWADR